MLKFKSLFLRFVALFSVVVVLAQGVAFWVIESVSAYSAWQGVVAGLAVSILGIALVSKFIADDLKKVIHVLIRQARAVENGDKREALVLRRKDEFVNLAEAMNRLGDRDKAIRDANEDPLTGLVNRRYFMQRLEKAVEKQTPVAVMFIDLDGFKPINDDYGHDVGDEALRIVSDRMSACVRESDVLARMGGDEFVMLFYSLTDRDILTERAEKVLEMVGMPMWISGHRIRMGASIGVSLYPKDGEDAEAVLNAADESMYAAKEGGKNAFRFYS